MTAAGALIRAVLLSALAYTAHLRGNWADKRMLASAARFARSEVRS